MADKCPECQCELPAHYGSCSTVPADMKAMFAAVDADHAERGERIKDVMGRRSKQTGPIHLASLNLFREPDGTVKITVAGAPGAMVEWDSGFAAKYMVLPSGSRPVDYVEELIIEAAEDMKGRRHG